MFGYEDGTILIYKSLKPIHKLKIKQFYQNKSSYNSRRTFKGSFNFEALNNIKKFRIRLNKAKINFKFKKKLKFNDLVVINK